MINTNNNKLFNKDLRRCIAFFCALLMTINLITNTAAPLVSNAETNSDSDYNVSEDFGESENEDNSGNSENDENQEASGEENSDNSDDSGSDENNDDSGSEKSKENEDNSGNYDKSSDKADEADDNSEDTDNKSDDEFEAEEHDNSTENESEDKAEHTESDDVEDTFTENKDADSETTENEATETEESTGSSADSTEVSVQETEAITEKAEGTGNIAEDAAVNVVEPQKEPESDSYAIECTEESDNGMTVTVRLKEKEELTDDREVVFEELVISDDDSDAEDTISKIRYNKLNQLFSKNLKTDKDKDTFETSFYRFKVVDEDGKEIKNADLNGVIEITSDTGCEIVAAVASTAKNKKSDIKKTGEVDGTYKFSLNTKGELIFGVAYCGKVLETWSRDGASIKLGVPVYDKENDNADKKLVKIADEEKDTDEDTEVPWLIKEGTYRLSDAEEVATASELERTSESESSSDLEEPSESESTSESKSSTETEAYSESDLASDSELSSESESASETESSSESESASESESSSEPDSSETESDPYSESPYEDETEEIMWFKVSDNLNKKYCVVINEEEVEFGDNDCLRIETNDSFDIVFDTGLRETECSNGIVDIKGLLPIGHYVDYMDETDSIDSSLFDIQEKTDNTNEGYIRQEFLDISVLTAFTILDVDESESDSELNSDSESEFYAENDLESVLDNDPKLDSESALESSEDEDNNSFSIQLSDESIKGDVEIYRLEGENFEKIKISEDDIVYADGLSIGTYVVTSTTKKIRYICSDDESYEITVEYDSNSGIPDDAVLEVTELTETDSNYDEYVSQANEILGKDERKLLFARPFDIKLVNPDNGEKYEPDENVKVSMKFLTEEVEKAEELSVVHFKDTRKERQSRAAGKSQEKIEKQETMNGEIVEAEVMDGSVEFETGSFSVFVFTGYTVDSGVQGEEKMPVVVQNVWNGPDAESEAYFKNWTDINEEIPLTVDGDSQILKMDDSVRTNILKRPGNVNNQWQDTSEYEVSDQTFSRLFYVDTGFNTAKLKEGTLQKADNKYVWTNTIEETELNKWINLTDSGHTQNGYIHLHSHSNTELTGSAKNTDPQYNGVNKIIFQYTDGTNTDIVYQSTAIVNDVKINESGADYYVEVLLPSNVDMGSLKLANTKSFIFEPTTKELRFAIQVCHLENTIIGLPKSVQGRARTSEEGDVRFDHISFCKSVPGNGTKIEATSTTLKAYFQKQYTITNSLSICKIVDTDGVEHCFPTLNDAVKYARDNKATLPMDPNHPVAIEMLMDYVIPSTDKVTLNESTDNIIITTAATSGGMYNFTPTFDNEQGRTSEDSDDMAILQRGFYDTATGTSSGVPLFYLNNSYARLKTENITLDGGYETDEKYTGRAVYVNNGDTCFTDGTTVRNFHTAAAGGAVYVGNGGNHTLIDNSSNGSVVFSNCGNEISTRNDDGGAICIQSGNLIINNSGAGTILFEKITGNKDTDGGAIGANSSCSITLNNTSTGTVRFKDCTACYGGAMETDSGGTVTLNNSGTGLIEFLHCYTDYAYEGGSIYCGGKFSTVNNGAITFTGTIGTEAEAKTKTTYGGAIYVYSSDVDACSITGSGQMSFTNCKANSDGGAIYSKGGVTINQTGGTSFTNCTATRNGGGIYSNDKTTTITNASFTDCSSGSTSTSSSNGGGGIYGKRLNISNSTFTDCTAKAWGGAILGNASDRVMHTVTNCTFDGHKDLDGNTMNAANGGAVGIYDGSLTMSGCELHDFTASNAGGAVNMGGGGNDSLSLENCIFDGHDNLASTVKNAPVGGAIRINADNGTTLKNLTVSDCWTSGNGGGICADDAIISTEGIISFTDCYTTGGNGGGAYFYTATTFGKIDTTGNTITFTRCHDDSTNTSYGGGGAWFNSTMTLQENTNLSFDSCYAGSYGGGAWFNAVTTLNNGTVSFKDCYATKRGGGAYFANTYTSIINTAVTFEKCYTTTTSTSDGGGGAYFYKTATFNNTEFKDCYSTGSNGGGAYFNSTANLTGAEAVAFKGCHADSTNTSNGGGGAYFANTAILNNTEFEDCYARSNGGAIYQNGSNALTLTNVTFGKANTPDSGCTADLEGGCIYSKGSIATLTDCNFYYGAAGDASKGNKARGGAIYYRGSTSLSIHGCVFDHCSVQTTSANSGWGNGGAIFVDDTNIALTIDKSDSGRRSSFTDCFAHRFGGAVMYEQNGGKSVSISNTDFTGCYTEIRGGGAVCPDSNKTTIDNCTFEGCYDKSNSGGGAIQLHPDNSPGSNPSCSITNSTFEDCYTVSGNGGAIYEVSGSAPVTLINVSINGKKDRTTTNANAVLGSAIYSKGNLTIKQSETGTSEIKNCLASGTNGGAVNVTGNSTTMTFEGNVVVYGNTNTRYDKNNQHNVVLEKDNSTTILTSNTGIGASAHIGVYVTGNNASPYNGYGRPNDPFSTMGGTDSGTYIFRFTNDRNNSWGVKRTGTTIYWNDPIVKVTDKNNDLLYELKVDNNGTENDVYLPAVYEWLNDGLTATRGTLYTLSGTTYSVATAMDTSNLRQMKMLRDYVIPKSDQVTLNQSTDNIIITTAETTAPSTADTYIFADTLDGKANTDKGTAILKRGDFTDASLFDATNDSAKIAFRKIILDGDNKEVTVPGGLAHSAGIMEVLSGTTMRNTKSYGSSNPAKAYGGGGAIWANDVAINGNTGNILFDNCFAKYSGGAIYYANHFDMNDNSGSITFNDCSTNGSAKGDGGAISNWESGSDHVFTATNNSGSIEFINCRAENNQTQGGAIFQLEGGNITMASTGNGRIRFSDCYAGAGGDTYCGGAISAWNANVTISLTGTATSPIVFENCYANTGNGGAIYTPGNVVMTNVRFGGYKTDANGNYVGVDGKLLKDGEKPVVDSDLACHAAGSGGSVYAGGSVTYTSTAGASHTGCYGSYGSSGGAIYSSSVSLNDNSGTLNFDGCYTTGSGAHGGAIRADNGVTMNSNSGNIKFKDCHSGTKNSGDADGGAIAVYNSGSLSATNNTGSISFENCSTSTASNRQGGAFLVLKGSITMESKDDGEISFKNCSSNEAAGMVSGGAICLWTNGTGITLTGTASHPIVFEDCHSSGMGGAIGSNSGSAVNLTYVNIDGHTTGNPTSFVAGINATKGAAIFSNGNLKIVGGEIKNCSASDTNGGAVQVASGKTMTFGGDVVIYDNKSEKINLFTGDKVPVQANVVLSENSYERIRTSEEGLGINAKVGVYVTGNKITKNPYKDYGSVHDDFGKYATSTSNLDKFINDRNGLKGEKCTDKGHVDRIRWTSPLCKLTDKEGHLLFKDEDGMARPAIYDSFKDALGTHGEQGSLYDYEGNQYDEDNSISLEMLKNYTQKSDDRIQYLSARNITFTTAKSGIQNEYLETYRDDFVFINNSSTNNNNNNSMTAIITRGAKDGSSDNSMIKLENSNSTVTIEKLILDGDNKEFAGNGAIIDIGESNLILGDGATLRKGKTKTSGNGGAVYVGSKGNLTLKSGGKIDNNTTSGNGGAVYIEPNGTFTMQGGEINSNTTSGNGGAVYIESQGTLILQGGEINKNTVTDSGLGAGVYVSEGATLKLDGNVNFGGSGVDENGEIDYTTGNIAVDSSLPNDTTNGGKTYSEARQDIYIEEFNDEPSSLVITKKASDIAAGSIWVYAESNKHYKKYMPFAVIEPQEDESQDYGLDENVYKAFRNAQLDSVTLCDGDYLSGSKGEKEEFIYWSVEANAVDVYFKKIDGYGNMLDGDELTGTEFTLYNDVKCEDVFKQTVEVDDEDTNKEKFNLVFKEVPEGTYYMKETKYDTNKFRDSGKVYVVCVGSTALDGAGQTGDVLEDIAEDVIKARTIKGETKYDYAIFCLDDSKKAKTVPDISTYGVMNISKEDDKVIMKKTDKSYKPLVGAEFDILSYDMTPIAKGKGAVSHKAGIFWVGKLPYGKYYIKETRLPDGTSNTSTTPDFTLIYYEDAKCFKVDDYSPTT